MIICQHDQGSPEWLQDRCGIITASEFKKICTSTGKPATGKTREDYLLSKMNERLTGLPVGECFTSQWMQNGTEREPDARSLYELLTDSEVTEVGLILDDLKRIGASVDGLVGDDGLVEFKCPKLPNHLRYLHSGKCPTEYIAQVQGQMYITDRTWCDFVSYHPEAYQPMFIVRVERDEKFIANLKEHLNTFLTEMDLLIAQIEERKDAA